MIITKRADTVRKGDQLYREANDSTGTVLYTRRIRGMVHIMATHFDREVPAATMMKVVVPDVDTGKGMPIVYRCPRDNAESAGHLTIVDGRAWWNCSTCDLDVDVTDLVDIRFPHQ